MSLLPHLLPSKYKQLGDVLLQALGNERSQVWLAECTFVTQEAVSQWLTGYSRPRPDRLGHLAALLQLDPQLLIELAAYDHDPKARDKIFAAYTAWCSLLSK